MKKVVITCDTTYGEICQQHHMDFSIFKEANSPYDDIREQFFGAMCVGYDSDTETESIPPDQRVKVDCAHVSESDICKAGSEVRVPLTWEISGAAWNTEGTLLGEVFDATETFLCILHGFNAAASGALFLFSQLCFQKGTIDDLNKRLKGQSDSYYLGTGISVKTTQKSTTAVGGESGKAQLEKNELNGPQAKALCEAAGSTLSEGWVKAEDGGEFWGIDVPSDWIFKGMLPHPKTAAEGTSRAFGNSRQLNEQDLARLWYSIFVVFNTARCQWPSKKMIREYRAQCNTFMVNFLACGSFDHTPWYLHAVCCHSWYWLELYGTLRKLSTDLNETVGKQIKAMIRCTTSSGATGMYTHELKDSPVVSASEESQGLGICGHQYLCRTLYHLQDAWMDPATVEGLPTSAEIMADLEKTREEGMSAEELYTRRSYFFGHSDWFQVKWKKDNAEIWKSIQIAKKKPRLLTRA